MNLRRPLWPLACGALLLLATPSAPAEERPPALPVEPGAAALPDVLTLDTWLELVRWRSPALAVERVGIDAARADVVTAGTLPNPVVSSSRQAGRRGAASEHEAAIEQPLPIFGQRGLRQANARLGVRAVRARVDAQVASVQREAGLAFLALQAADARVRLEEALLADFDDAARIVAGQVEAGSRSRYERTRIEVERAALSAAAERQRAEAAEAAARLALQVGAPGWRPRTAAPPTLPAPAAAASQLWSTARERLPAVRAARADAAQARQRIDLERREAWPVPSFGVGRVRDGEGRHTVLGVAVAIPLFDRNQGPIARARAEADALVLRQDAVERQAEADLQRAADQFARRRALAERYQQEALAPLPELRRMARDAYTLGRGGILEFIDALTSAAEREATQLDLLEAALAAELDLRFATGQAGGVGPLDHVQD
ncbi:TolC family protein [uncultured Xylophilus sp.]|uniref:TolC family protein n=1 Tax=uncultured Xylophilus sp. TaxID=296832 RepID=UPI0025FEE6FE|nr:TolC family protein [uncultured Xylophilus sp.]